MGLDDIMIVPEADGVELLNRFKKYVSVDAATKKKGINIDSFINVAQQGHFEEGSIHEILENCELLLCSTPPPPRVNSSSSGTFAENSHKALLQIQVLVLKPDFTKDCKTIGSGPLPSGVAGNAELEERISKLKAEQANKEYKSMTQNLLPREKTIESFREDIKSMQSQIIAVINFVLTVGGSFCFVYKAVEYALPQENIPAQTLMAVLASTVVAVADLYFLLKTI
ncbi:UNVERIFIED_CONTAM: transmembrane protein [Trichonephila clavipes]